MTSNGDMSISSDIETLADVDWDAESTDFEPNHLLMASIGPLPLSLPVHRGGRARRRSLSGGRTVGVGVAEGPHSRGWCGTITA